MTVCTTTPEVSTPIETKARTLCVPRSALLALLRRAKQVIPTHCIRPCWRYVRLFGTPALLTAQATDGEISLTTSTEADGDGLDDCAADIDLLLKRVRAGKADMALLSFDGETLTVNGGAVKHSVPARRLDETEEYRRTGETETVTRDVFETLPHPHDFTPADHHWPTVPTASLRAAALAMATESTRYAINGVLLDVTKVKDRLVGTDGRRLVAAEIPASAAPDGFSAIIFGRAISLALKMAGKAETVEIHAQCGAGLLTCISSAETWTAGEQTGPTWALCCRQVEGNFPNYQDVIPDRHHQYIIDRAELIKTVAEIETVVAGSEAYVVKLAASADALTVSARDPQTLASSTATIPATAGRNTAMAPPCVEIGLNPSFLLDALRSLPGERVTLDLDSSVRPAMLTDADAGPVAPIRWVVMCVSL